jgi:2'-hydroxyisoflavone reductase
VNAARLELAGPGARLTAERLASGRAPCWDEGMTDVLVLGGTGWLSGEVARRWMDAGARVTCLARGGRDAPYGAALVTADRDAPDAYVDVAARDWDEVVDISSRPEHVAAALEALGPRARHWTYVSSVSVYASDEVAGEDESAPLADPAEAGDPYDYARAKAACEESVRVAVGARAAIVRPGLVVGPGDPTDRFGYWVARFALAGAEPVLVPDTTDRMAQVIDVRDLADFLVAAGDARWVGVANAVGDPTPLARVLELARETAGHTGALSTADDAWLEAHAVQHWMGPRSLPLWLPADMPGFATRSPAVYRLLGGRLRDLRATLTDTLGDERARGVDRARLSGLSRPEEEALLAER